MLHKLMFCCLTLVAAPVLAQETAPWDFAVPQPPADTFSVTRDVPFGGSGPEAPRMDVYRPRAGSAEGAPTLIIFNAARTHPFFTAWAQYAASRGLVAILPDVRRDAFEQDVDLLLDHLAAHGATVGVNREAIAVYAPSGIVSLALPVVQNPKRKTVKAAVVYYGTGEVAAFRPDLPLLVVRAGLDRPPLNQGIAAMVAAALTQNAPISVVNFPGGYHAFETANKDEATRDVLEKTIDFVKRATSPAYREALLLGVAEATAAGHVASGRVKEAAEAYAAIVATRPDAATLRLAYVEALSANGQFADACAEADKLKGKGLGPRDLGLPAARACMQKGDPDAAIAWLRSIPVRFLPPAVASEAVFASIKERADFKAVFQPR
jgi:dienelactone hydrolase